MSCCCCRVAAGDRMLALPCSFFLLWKNHSPVHTFARYYEELTLNSTSRLIIDANLPTFFSPVSTTYLYIIRSVGRVPSFFLSSSSYLILIHFSFIFLFFLFLSLVSPRFPEWVGVKKKGGGCRWWWVVVVVPAGLCSRSAGLAGLLASAVVEALLSRLFQLSTLSELTATRSFTHTSRVSVLHSFPIHFARPSFFKYLACTLRLGAVRSTV